MAALAFLGDALFTQAAEFARLLRRVAAPGASG
jgi:hypothetical protein